LVASHYTCPSPVLSDSIRICYNLSRRADYVHIRVYTVADRRVAAFDGPTGVGNMQAAWPASGLANGVYFYLLDAHEGGKTEVRLGKFMILR
jgi:hypothetical protein